MIQLEGSLSINLTDAQTGNKALSVSKYVNVDDILSVSSKSENYARGISIFALL